jgi:hypothetical protein
MIDRLSKTSYNVRAHSPEEMDAWTQIFKEIRKIGALGPKEFNSLIAKPLRMEMDCQICKKRKSIFELYSTDEMILARKDSLNNSFACVSCLSSRVLTASKSSNSFLEAISHYSIQDLQDVMNEKQFQEFVESSLESYITSAPEEFAECPKCKVSVEIVWGNSADLMGVQLKGLDERPVRPEALKHYLAHRVRCRTPACYTDFCSKCKVSPYHTGYDCVEYVEFLSAPKCRFCRAPVTQLTKYRIDHPAFVNVCNQAECMKKVIRSCDKKLPCGHFCFGYKGEKECPPCLFPDCPSRSPETPIATDSCGICLSEDLGLAPYIFLKCNHGFHRDCIDARLEKGYSGSRITFDFASCPLCKVDLSHPDLESSLKPIRLLQKEISDKALERLKYEGLDKSDDIVDPNGRFYRDPVGFAMDHFSFYKCFECRKPYFAGARECGPAGGDEDHPDDDPADLICGSCSNVSSFDICAVHGADWISYKCKFCCTIASFHCWGNTHFCINCHNPGIWDKLSKFKTGENLKPIEDYSQCAGVREKIDQWIKEHPKASAEEKYDAFSKIYSDPVGYLS